MSIHGRDGEHVVPEAMAIKYFQGYKAHVKVEAAVTHPSC